VTLQQLSKVQLVDQNKGATASGTPLKLPIENFYFTDVISRRYVELQISPFSTSLLTPMLQLTNDGSLLGREGNWRPTHQLYGSGYGGGQATWTGCLRCMIAGSDE
jgi:NADH dehydrogenase (ubiquinone) Fe-S protein 1